MIKLTRTQKLLIHFSDLINEALHQSALWLHCSISKSLWIIWILALEILIENIECRVYYSGHQRTPCTICLCIICMYFITNTYQTMCGKYNKQYTGEVNALLNYYRKHLDVKKDCMWLRPLHLYLFFIALFTNSLSNWSLCFHVWKESINSNASIFTQKLQLSPAAVKVCVTLCDYLACNKMNVVNNLMSVKWMYIHAGWKPSVFPPKVPDFLFLLFCLYFSKIFDFREY